MAEIVGTVASFLGPAIEVGKCIAEPIKRQFNYLCCFNSNIQSLRDEAKELDDVRDGLQMRVAAAENNVEVIVPVVKTWLEKVNEIKDNMSRIENEVPNVKSGWLSIKARFSLSKRAKKAAAHMKELRESCKFDSVSEPAPPAATVPGPLGTVYEFESRKQIEEDIMTALRSKNVNMIGICGMGGVGKTTMAKKIMNRVIEEHLFDEIVMAVVSQKVDMLTIQQEIAEPLGLKLEDQTLRARAQRLRDRLTGIKRVFIVLDDVWENLTLEDLGIPSESGFRGCIVLLTSRNWDVLSAMIVEKEMIFGLPILSEGEAWLLFREKVGACVDDPKLHSIAEEVIEECKGLPIALIIVARVLKDENNISIWKDALQQLKKSNPIDLQDVTAQVYNSLKLSYDLLPIERAKSLFLLCCLFPEDHNIFLEHLTYFAMGLLMFKGISNLEEARNRIYALIKMLKNRFLLLDGGNEYHVKMHDVVRDVAIFIAKEKRYINGNDCAWISSFVPGKAEYPVKLDFPSLRLLFINEQATKKEFQVNDSFFEGSKELNVLFIADASLRSLPCTTQFLKDLRTLVIDSCRPLTTISVVGELENLEILICSHCDSIEELPLEIGGLDHLRLLEISRCRSLKTIAPTVISNLVALEELKIMYSFKNWEAEDNERKERKNARLRELESLSNLTCLEIEVKDYTLAAEEICLSSMVSRFDIAIGDNSSAVKSRDPSSERFHKKLYLKLSTEISLGYWTNMFLRSTEYLHLSGDGSNNLDVAQENIRSLTWNMCSTVKSITASIDWRPGAAIFPLLESLTLDNLANLEETIDIDGPISSNSFKSLKKLRLLGLPALKHLCKSPYQNNVVSLFSNLTSIIIFGCNSLRNLFSLSVVTKDCLLQLKSLVIWSCDMMEQVFLWNEEENQKDSRPKNHQSASFPKLKRLELVNMRNLTALWKGIENIEFPRLNKIEILHCPKLQSLVSCSGGINIGHNDEDDDSLHLLCKPKSSFVGLGLFKIWGCNGIRSLFSSSVAENLVNLKSLDIEYCKTLIEVIEDEEEEESISVKTLIFPRLQYLELCELPKLEMFCKWRCALELPSLEILNITWCHQLERFTLGSIDTPNLKSLKIDGTVMNTKDLNDALLQKKGTSTSGVKEE